MRLQYRVEHLIAEVQPNLNPEKAQTSMLGGSVLDSRASKQISGLSFLVCGFGDPLLQDKSRPLGMTLRMLQASESRFK